MKQLTMKKKIRTINRNRVVSLHPHQLKMIGVKDGEEVEVSVDKNKIIIEKIRKA